MTDFLERLRAMPGSLNDALRTLDFAAAYIEELQRIERIDALIAKQLSQSMAINAQLKNRIAALETALRFYACEGHWLSGGQCDLWSSRFEGPNVARAALDSGPE